MNEQEIKRRAVMATLRLGARFNQFADENRALLTEETQVQLSQIVSDLLSTASLLGIEVDASSLCEVEVLRDLLESYASGFADKREYLSKIAELAAESYDAAQAG